MTTTLPCFFIHSSDFEKYHYPPTSPFKTERAGKTRELLRSMGLYEGINRREFPPRLALDDTLLWYHTPEYLDALRKASAGELNPDMLRMGLGAGDCPVFPDLFSYASLAAGATVTGAGLILDGIAHIAFNPSGGFHHAKAAEAGGFCYINDIALGCRTLANAGKRVFCLDLDVHHGNGTQEAFYHDSSVFTVSLHESGKTLFPWGGTEQEIGEDSGKGYNVNLPFPPGTDDDIYVAAFKEVVPPLIEAYKPDVIVLELGMDVLSVDPLAHLKMTNNAFADLLPELMSYDLPMLVTGGGGYNPEHTARGWALMWVVLTGKEMELESDLSIGMGGVFIGSSEWKAGLRDPRIYATGADRKQIITDVQQSVETIKRLVFPIHGIQ